MRLPALFKSKQIKPKSILGPVDSAIIIDGVSYDLCVSCQINTGIRTDLPVGKRSYYVEGGGQLCVSCWRSIYGIKCA